MGAGVDPVESRPHPRKNGAMEENWAEQRRRNAAAQAERLRERDAFESSQAAQHLEKFVKAARREGVEPEPLFVKAKDGKHRAKTPLRGWYLKADQSVAVDEGGDFYILISPLTLKERLTGVKPKASPPPLILGKGGRDGEQIDLTEALGIRIPNWRD